MCDWGWVGQAVVEFSTFWHWKFQWANTLHAPPPSPSSICDLIIRFIHRNGVYR
jgi:hypothetical protein